MARQQDSCWRCGTPWVSADAPALRLIPGDSASVARWTNEGGRSGSEVTLPLAATAGAAR
jgi:hypothetical protein